MSSKMSYDHDLSSNKGSSSYGSSADEGPAPMVNGISTSPAPNDNWMGQKYIEYYLAQSVADSAGTNDPNSDLDSRLESALQSFDHARCWTYLRSKGVGRGSAISSGGGSPRETLLPWIGFIISEGGKAEKSLLRRAMHKSMNPVPSGNGSPPQQQHEIAVYTSLLNEYGQTEQHEPKYSWTTFSREPLIYQCTVVFQHVKASGRGRKKMQAKHEASFGLCQRLNIHPD